MADETRKLKFEDALGNLEKLTDEIERGEIGLEESIDKYAAGMKLVAHCRKILGKAEQRIQKLSPSSAEEERRDTDATGEERSQRGHE